MHSIENNHKRRSDTQNAYCNKMGKRFQSKKNYALIYHMNLIQKIRNVLPNNQEIVLEEDLKQSNYFLRTLNWLLNEARKLRKKSPLILKFLGRII